MTNEDTKHTSSEHEGDDEIEDEKLPFARAQVVRVMRESIAKDKMIKAEVKDSMNLFLADICSDVSKKMDKYPYAMIDRRMFDEAVEPYKTLYKVEEEKKRIVKHLEAIKADCDRLIRCVEETFKTE